MSVVLAIGLKVSPHGRAAIACRKSSGISYPCATKIAVAAGSPGCDGEDNEEVCNKQHSKESKRSGRRNMCSR
jgi:hypothetical protein